ncbi:hypothetical protein PUMCH_001316 [Australozyma saopauloensis]|uniref:Uncharacterized protein n=1 Tax=Australozyma saopauloensis TaxID=291208 RepID=A0AAX4H8N9_9ASCO|nr:hypothetical protein PUMCH_001316 [[Candida] saopauloensis]
MRFPIPASLTVLTLLTGIVTAENSQYKELQDEIFATKSDLYLDKFPEIYRRSLNTRSSARSVRSNELKVTITDPVPQTSKTKIVIESITDFLNPKLQKRLSNISNYFITSNRETLIYFDRELKEWMLHKFKEKTSDIAPKAGDKIALARCLSTAHGGSGYVTSQLDVSVYAESTFASPIDVILMDAENTVIASLSFGLNLGGAAGFTGSITCNAVEGQFVQPFLYPYFFQVPPGRRIKVRVDDDKGLETQGEWHDTALFLRVLARGLLECAVGSDSSICQSSIPVLPV